MFEVHTHSGVHTFTTQEEAEAFIDAHFRAGEDDDLWVMTWPGHDWYGGDYFSTDKRIQH